MPGAWLQTLPAALRAPDTGTGFVTRGPVGETRVPAADRLRGFRLLGRGCRMELATD